MRRLQTTLRNGTEKNLTEYIEQLKDKLKGKNASNFNQPKLVNIDRNTLGDSNKENKFNATNIKTKTSENKEVLTIQANKTQRIESISSREDLFDPEAENKKNLMKEHSAVRKK
jgi:hypothetical protein